jgi:hypothetical protein
VFVREGIGQGKKNKISNKIPKNHHQPNKQASLQFSIKSKLINVTTIKF